jgi:hypothetical protein
MTKSPKNGPSEVDLENVNQPLPRITVDLTINGSRFTIGWGAKPASMIGWGARPTFMIG